MKWIIGKFILTQEQVKSGGKLNFCLFKGLKLSDFMGNRLKKNYIYIYMPLVHFVLFKTTLRKTFWPYMKILSKNTSLLPPESMIPPFHILFTPLFHFLPLLILFHSFFFLLHSFIFYYILLHFVSFCFISLHLVSFRLHFASFRFISHHFASFRIISLHFVF